MSILIKSHDVEYHTRELSTIAKKERLDKMIGNNRYSCNVKKEILCDSLPDEVVDEYGNNSFMNALSDSYNYHYDFTIGPDMIWLLIQQGFNIHINENAEKYRSVFLQHEGKKDLIVEAELPTNKESWRDYLGKLSTLILTEVGEDIHSTMVAAFTTTGLDEKVASEVTMMKTFSEYFSYGGGSDCGIPQIKLLGTVKDWLSVRMRADKLLNLVGDDLDWWKEMLFPFLEKIWETSKGDSDQSNWWREFYKFDHPGSGNPYVSGHITNIFPYISLYGQNRRHNERTEISVSHIPSGMNKVEIIHREDNREKKMLVWAGLSHYTMDEDGFLVPGIGWAVTTDQTEEQTE